MSGKQTPLYYWDANIYTAWLNKEASHGAHLSGIDEILEDNFQLKNRIVTSTITVIEVLSCRLTPEQEKQFRKLFTYTNHEKLDVDTRIAEKARELREAFLVDDSKNLATPDAIHLATAIINEAHEMHSFDDGKKKSGGMKSVSLLGISKDSRISGLTICKPPPSMSLFAPQS